MYIVRYSVHSTVDVYIVRYSVHSTVDVYIVRYSVYSTVQCTLYGTVYIQVPVRDRCP